ncbi:MAG: tripartite tricarboxylate transporter substrate binding protein [Burkholderiaceae bacterium]
MKLDKTLSVLAAVAAISSLACAATDAAAQSAAAWPSRPVHIVVPTPAGGPSDTIARTIAQSLSAAWRQPVVVENKPGAGGALAAQAAMASPPDGHTLLWAPSSLAGLPMVQKNAPFRNLGELSPVSNVVQFEYALFVANDVPAKTFAELVAYGRANPEKLNFATGTLGEYMVGAHVLRSAGVKAVRVPYKGGAQVMPDLVSGQVQLNFGPIVSGLQHAKQGRLKVLATMLGQRSPLLPDVPTAAELGVAPAELPSWNAIYAPRGTPRDVAEKIAGAVADVLRSPAIRATLAQQGAVPIGSTPQQLADATDAATAAWKAFVRDYEIPQE